MKDGYPRKFGPYVLLRPLARGGMGALHLAIHGERGMEKQCAVKTVLPHLVGKGYVQRFRDEAKIVVRLSHGNLVTVFDAGQVDGEIFLAMDFVEGRDLRGVWNRCAQKGLAFPVDIAVHIIKELCRGLGYAHQFEGLNLVHRDVSPPNVLISYTGEVKLTDFGLASSSLKLEKTAPGIIYGKVSYMAPEQARGEHLDGRADLYAAAIILWELLTGRQLFPSRSTPDGPAASDDEILEKVRNPEVVPPSKKASRVPAALEAIVLKALAVDPAKRYQTGEEFRADLAAFQAKTAPATDGDHVARFLRELFGEDIQRERTDRAALAEEAAALLSSGTGPLPVRSHDSEAETPGPKTAEPESSSDNTQSLSTDKDAASRIVGMTLGGRYLIRKLVGEGGMGRVYEAEHTEIGKRVAVKVLHPAFTRTPEVVERFRREARASSKVGHPHIVNVTDSGTTDDGSFFFVMEFVEGVELGLVIYKEGPLRVSRALALTEQICAALQAAHDVGVIHRDLKPENILLVGKTGETDYVKVLDFGIAKSAEVEENAKSGRRLTRPGVAMGTPEYMAPEQAAGKSADPRSDIYAVGSILYEMLTGVPPYDGDNVMEVLHKKANELPRPAGELRPDLPPVVETLINRAMARNPADRPQSMAAMGVEIRVLLDAMGIGSFRDPTVTKISNPRRESPLLTGAIDARPQVRRWGASRAAIAAGSVALLVAAAVVVVRASSSRPPEAPPVAVAPPPPPAPAPVVETPPQTPPEAPPAVAEAPPAPEPKTRGKKSRGAVATPSASAGSRQKLLDEAQSLLRAQRYDDARSVFNKLVDDRKGAGPALLGLGRIAFQKQDYSEAVRRGQQSANKGGGVEARLLLGDALFRLKKYEDAKKAYSEVLKRDSQNARARSGLVAAERFSH